MDGKVRRKKTGYFKQARIRKNTTDTEKERKIMGGVK